MYRVIGQGREESSKGEEKEIFSSFRTILKAEEEEQVTWPAQETDDCLLFVDE